MTIETTPIPVGGKSKYRALALELVNAFTRGEAIILPEDFPLQRSADVRHQVDRIIWHYHGGAAYRIQSLKREDGRRMMWIRTHDHDLKAWAEAVREKGGMKE